MPYSYSLFKNEVRDHLVSVLSPEDKILDVGPGSGTYGDMLKDYNIDAIEIFTEYVDQFKLWDKYGIIYLDDIRNFDLSLHVYDYIIMGDVLEHLPVHDAQELLSKIQCKYLVAVPYMFEQGEEFGNVYETHHQPDLTHEIFMERYPHMYCLFRNNEYGYYVSYPV